MNVRLATIADAPRLSAINAAAWKVAYRGQLSQDALDARHADDRIEMWTEIFSSETNTSETIVAEHDGVVMGYAHYGPQRHGDEPTTDAPTVGEIYAFYVSPDAWRGGVGSTLMAAAEAGLVNLNFDSAVLWALVTNLQARAFYEARGWIHVDVTRTGESRGLVVTETHYRKAFA